MLGWWRRRLRRGTRLVIIFIFAVIVVAHVVFTYPELFNMKKTQLSDTKNKVEIMNNLVGDGDQIDTDEEGLEGEDHLRHATRSKERDSRRDSTQGSHKESKIRTTEKGPDTCSDIHTFYYPWYGNPTFDGKYLHWNHALLPHWNPDIAKNYMTGRHHPPADIGSDFYPVLGPYSSKDPAVIDNHLRFISSAGIGVIAVSYYPPGEADKEGKSWARVFELLFDKALKYNIKITFHIEPYTGRNELTVFDDIRHIIDTYGHHPALYRYTHGDRHQKPLIYVYDSYHTSPAKWSTIFDKEGVHTIRGTPYDVIAIALLVDLDHSRYITEGKFDGFYTYFATDGFTFGSTWHNWKTLSNFAKQAECLFIPSVGPGYIDTSIRPWNAENTRERKNGRYYTNAWLTALQEQPDLVSITSFNEWHEGTQIEPAVQKSVKERKYLNYEPNNPNFYIQLTNQFKNKFLKCKSNENIKADT